MSKQCRLCAKFTESVIDLFLEHESTLLTKINSFLPTTISNLMGLPTKICCKCVDKTNETHSFIQEVMLAQAVFGIPCETSAKPAPPANSVTYGGVTISSSIKAAIKVASVNQNVHKKSQNVSETLRKLKKMQTGMTISKKIVPGVKPIRKCKTEPKFYGEDNDDDIEDTHFDGGVSDNEWSYENGNNDDDDDDEEDESVDDDNDEDYKPSSKKSKTATKTTHIKPNVTVSNSKFESVKVNAPPVFLCMKCKNKFDTLADLKRHVFQKNSCTTTQLTCDVCAKTFDSRKQLIQHKKVHEEKPKFVCDKCGKIFLKNFNLVNHKSQEHGEYVAECQNVFKCRLCHEKYTNRTDLFAHMKTHNKEKQQLLCDLCGKYFNSSHNLKAHQKVHLDIRPFPCTVCPKSFRTRLALKQHMHVHTGIKEFQCMHCSQLFAKADSLRKHTRKRHPEIQKGQQKSTGSEAPKQSAEIPVSLPQMPTFDPAIVPPPDPSLFDGISTKMEINVTN